MESSNENYLTRKFFLLVPLIEESCTLLGKDSDDHEHEHVGKGRQ